MRKILNVLAIILLLAIVGCSYSIDNNVEENDEAKPENYSFTGEILEINDEVAIVYATFEDRQGDVYVDLSVNKTETFQVGNKIKVEYDGIILYSNPAQINTLSVKNIKD